MQCPLCVTHGRNRQLQTFQINLTEAIQLCEEPGCPFPVGTNSDVVETFSRDLSEIKVPPIHKVVPSGPAKSQLALQAQVSSRLQAFQQSSTSALQTGSPQLIPRRCKPLLTQDVIPHRDDGQQSGRKSRACSENGIVRKDSQRSEYNTKTQTGKSGSNGCHGNGSVKKPLLLTDEIRSGRQSRQSRSGKSSSGRRGRASDDHTSRQKAGSWDYTKPLSQKSNGNIIPSRLNFAVDTNASQELTNGVKSEDGSFDDWLGSLVGPSCSESGTEGIKNEPKSIFVGKFNCVKSSCESRSSSSSSNYEGFHFGKTSKKMELPVNGKTKRQNLVNEIIGKVSVKGSLVEKLGGRKGLETPLTDLTSCYNGVLAEGLPSPNVINGAQRTNNVLQVNGNACNGEIRRAVDENKLQDGSVKSTCTQYMPIFPQWTNVDALCWLDVILCLLVHNVTLSRLVFSEKFDKSSVIYKLLKAHKQAKLLSSQLTSVSKSTSTLSNVSGSCGKLKKNIHSSSSNGKPQPAISSSRNDSTNCIETSKNKTDCGNVPNVSSAEDVGRLDEIRSMLDSVRDDVCAGLKDSLKWKKGRAESPVFAFPLLLRANPAAERMFKMIYRFEFSCPRCRQTEVTHHQNVLPTLPATVSDFNMRVPAHPRKCFRCGNLDGKRSVVYQSLPPCVMMHFADGLPEIPWSDLQFDFHGNQYVVTGCVQYVRSPDHFISWLRNPQDDTWAKCDDLAGPMCTFSARSPSFSRKQVHIVMWEQTKDDMDNVVFGGPNVQKSSNHNVGGGDKPKNNTQSCSSLLSRKQTITNLCSTLQKQTVVDDVDVAQSRKGSSSFTRQSINHRNLKPMSASRQQMVDPHRFLTSSILLPASACSPTSMDSPGTDWSDIKMLPKFVNEVVVTGTQVPIRPVPSKTGTDVRPANCKTECRTLNISKSSMSIENSKVNGAIGDLDVSKQSTKHSSSKCSGNVIDGIDKSSVSVIAGPVVAIKPSSVFHSVKSAEGLNVERVPPDHQKSPVDSVKSADGSNLEKVSPEQQKSMVDCVANGQFERASLRNQTKMDDGSFSSVDSSGTDKCQNSSHSVDTNKFKIPLSLSCFMKKSKSTSNLSKEAFKVLNVSKNDRKTSVSETTNGSFNPTIPVLNGNLTYLNSVKQYLIGKTTSVAECRFEGLNLKSAPSVNSNLNLTGLKLSSSTPNSMCSFDSQRNISPVSEFFGRKELHVSSSRSVSSGRKRKFSSAITESPVVKKNKGSSNISDNTTCASVNSQHVSQSELGTRSAGRRPKSRNNVKTRNDRNFGADLSINGHGQNGTHNGALNSLLNGHLESNNVDKNYKESDTSLVLRDLYEALNIPYSAAKDTMSDIMDNVNDIIGAVDIADIVSGSPLKYGSGTSRKCGAGTPLKCGTGSGVGNQNKLDCWHSMTRFSFKLG